MINFVHLCGFLIRQNSSFYTLQCPSGFFPCRFSGVDPPALSSAVEILGHLENIETARCRSSSVLMILISYNEKPGKLAPAFCCYCFVISIARFVPVAAIPLTTMVSVDTGFVQ